MKISIFFIISAIGAFAFGCMMFFVPGFAAGMLNITSTPGTLSVLRGMGGLIIGSGAINFLVRNNNNVDTLRAVLWTNIITHAFGLGADVWGISDAALTINKMLPVEITHLFVGIGSLIYLIRLKEK